MTTFLSGQIPSFRTVKGEYFLHLAYGKLHAISEHMITQLPLYLNLQSILEHPLRLSSIRSKKSTPASCTSQETQR